MSCLAASQKLGGNIKKFPIGRFKKEIKKVGTSLNLKGPILTVMGCMKFIFDLLKAENINFHILNINGGEEQILGSDLYKFVRLKTNKEYTSGENSSGITQIDLVLPPNPTSNVQILDEQFVVNFLQATKHDCYQDPNQKIQAAVDILAWLKDSLKKLLYNSRL